MRLTSFAALALCSTVLAQDWSNLGGNAARNGLTSVVGPATATSLWSNTADFSIIAWAPFVHQGRVYTVRESGFPQNGGAAHDSIVCYDLDTGVELWRKTLPFNGNTSQQWIAWICGANSGRVYASRASNGQPQPVQALDAANGNTLWTSVATTTAFAYDGVVFAPNGDLFVGDFVSLTRIHASDGVTVWSVPRSRAVSGNCGAALSATGVFLDQVIPGGQIVTKLDPTTGATLYSSTPMPGFTEQNAPFVSPDGQTVYFSRTQNNTAVDFLFAFADNGSSLTEIWHRPVRWTTSHEHGIGPDGSIYTFLQTDEFVRLDPATGNVLNTAGVLAPLGSPNLSPKTAVDALGRVYVSNGWANTPSTNGRVWAFNADLTQSLFTLTLDNPNQGGPALGSSGTLVVCDRTAVKSFRSASASYCTAGTTTHGCNASIVGIGTPDANAGSGFTLQVSNVEGQKTGILFYGITGRVAVAWGTSSSFLCVKAPTQRTLAQTSNGTTNACDGVLSIDWNAYIAANPSALGVPYSGGETVDAQAWFRDPPSPKTTMLSNALEFTVAP